ncbi:T9SS type A sorting domain-containing protein [Paracrocinitomix mangrovi]|uniref:T9SS type A sorting domain-containing protein n=1 Tax=Paracrocinitomix mangrovi TaxID=2862509 RepID=UPI001C8D8BE6|nr:T9SS type A sorting domain-containing protein [Paracrocinitomix mangrovi]UKN02244.1 T9SS type A sorting domain-containing protein [Paracrocinitomix mangrovi]
MKKIVSFIFIAFLSVNLHAQFTVIPTGTNTIIRSMDFDADTLLILGNQNYFAKSYDLGGNIVFYPMSLPAQWVNLEIQEVNGMYYYMARETLPSVAHVIKSSDRGQSWDNLYSVSEPFTNLTMIDTSFGIMGGSYGEYAVTYGNDLWTIDSIFTGWSIETIASASYGDSTIFFHTLDGFSFITNDRGATWDWVYCDAMLYQAIQFINKDTIYSVGYSGSNADFVYTYGQSENFTNVWLGYNYQENKYDYHCIARDMYFDNPEHGYIFGYLQTNESIILETNDYGQTWIPYLTGFTDEFYCHIAFNDSISFIGGDNGLLLKWNRNIPLTNTFNIGIEEQVKKVKIYPNPMLDGTEISLVGIQLPIQLELYDQTGRLVRCEMIQNTNHVLKRGSLTAGVYYYTIGEIRGKLVVSE